MFTGIVEELGTVAAFDGSRLRIDAHEVLERTRVGDSIAVNGCCLTVVALGEGWWEADVSAETLARTTLGDTRPGEGVNLERAVRLEDRLGGHLVQGHVDGVGEVIAAAPDLQVRVPAAIVPFLVDKGSITVEGVSLTVVEPRGDTFSVAVIPHTAEVTTLGRRRPGDRVNLEADVVAKYVSNLLQPYAASAAPAAPAAPLTADAREALIRRVLGAASAGDIEAQLRCYTDDIVLEFPFGEPPGRLEGKAVIAERLRGAFESFRFTLSPHRFHHGERSTTVEFTGQGTYLPTGAAYDNTYVAIFEFDGALIRRQAEYFNTLYAARITGAV